MSKLTDVLHSGIAVVPQGAQEHAEIVVSKEAPEEEAMTETNHSETLEKAGVDKSQAEAFFKALAGEDGDAVVAAYKALAPDAEKDPEVEKAAEVAYTSPETGEVYTKSDDPRLVAMAKREDALIAKSRAAEAAQKYPNVPESIRKCVAESPEVRKSADCDLAKDLAQLNTRLGLVGESVGDSVEKEAAPEAAALAKANESYAAALEEFRKENDLSADVARVRFAPTPKGRELMKAVKSAPMEF